MEDHGGKGSGSNPEPEQNKTARRRAKISLACSIGSVVSMATLIILFFTYLNALITTKEELFMTQLANRWLSEGNNMVKAEKDSLAQVNEIIYHRLDFSQAKQDELRHLLAQANRKIKKLQKEIDDIKVNLNTSQIIGEFDAAKYMKKFWNRCSSIRH